MSRSHTAFLVVALVVIAALELGISRAQPQSTFLINVKVTESGAELACLRGCAWDRLSFACDDLPCEAGIDVAGVGGTHAQ